MDNSMIVQLYQQLEKAIDQIQGNQEGLYLDALADVLEYMHHGELKQVANFTESEALLALQQSLASGRYSKVDLHRAIQMALLKGMKEETQANHRMTPESVALFISYLIQKLLPDRNEIRIFNPGSGTGNLLHTVMGQIEGDLSAYACEIDETLIRISVMIANLLEQEIEYFHQDSLRPLLLDPVDLVIADLPVGYYPDQEQASRFALKAESGMSYAHHLFIEQGLYYTKPGGYLIFLIPEFLFTSDQADQLQQFLQAQAHIIGVFQLADSTFKAKEQKKSIFVIRKKAEGTKNVQQPLLVMLPSLKDTAAMENILVKINRWFEEASDDLV